MNVEQFLDTIPYMLKGMLGIFAVTAVIILTVVILNACSRRMKKK